MSLQNVSCFLQAIKNINDNDIATQQVNNINELTKEIENAVRTHKQRYKSHDFDMNHNMFYTTYIKYAMYVACTTFLTINLGILGVIPPIVMLIVAASISIVYLAVFYMEVKRNMIRRTGEWDKYYWNIAYRRHENGRLM